MKRMSTIRAIGVWAACFLAPTTSVMAIQDADQAPDQAPTRTHASATEVQGERAREASSAAAPTPQIGFIDSPGATCVQPNSAVNACYINWYYLSVNAAPNYILYTRVQINQRFVARYAGFFQTSMYIPHDMNGLGFKVPCGKLGSGGDPEMGRSYSYTIRSQDSANLASNNYGTVYCPAFQGAIK
jgi:hypothetical protein